MATIADSYGDLKGYRRLIVWQKADELAMRVYGVTKRFPKEELFGMISQVRRCALSVPTNIVEGYARAGKREKYQFCNIAYGSLSELEYLLDFSARLWAILQIVNILS